MIFKTDLDGNNSEGLGSILQRVMHLYAFGKILNVNIEIPAFKNLTHFQHENKTKDLFHKEINHFLPFKNVEFQSKKSFYISVNFLLLFFGELFLVKKKKHFLKLAKKINYNSKLYFSPTKKNIAIHIRNLNRLDTDFGERREVLNKERHYFYVNLLNSLVKNHNHYDIHVFSQGDIKEFQFLDSFQIQFHLNVPLIETFYHLMISEILVTANSSLSWTAHLFGLNQKVYSRASFFHSWYLDTILISKTGFPKGRLISYFNLQLNRIKFILLFIKIKSKESFNKLIIKYFNTNKG
jgi:hypothetical protein